MRDDRTDIIIEEIKYWKEHKLLSPVYCDYLLALYTQGEENSVDLKSRKKYKIMFLYTISIIFLTVLLPLSFLIIYFFSFPSFIKVGILSSFIAFTFIMFRYLKKQDYFFHHLALIVLLMLILLTTVFIVDIYTEQQWVTTITLFLNFVSWLILGRMMQVRYLTVCSFITILLMFIFIIQ